MGIFADLKSKANVRSLGYGIHDNVILEAVDITPRKKKDGFTKIDALMFLKFGKLNEDGTVVEANKEIMIWPLKHENKNNANADMAAAWGRDIQKLSAILACHYPAADVETMVDQLFGRMGITETAQLTSVLGVKGNMDTFNGLLRDQFVAAATPLVGLQSGKRFRLKLTYDKNGFVQLPAFGFIENPATTPSELVLDSYDEDMKANKEKLDAEAAAGKVNTGGGAPTPGGAPVATGAPLPGGAPAPATAAPAPAPVAANNPIAPAPVAEAAPVVAPVAEAVTPVTAAPSAIPGTTPLAVPQVG